MPTLRRKTAAPPPVPPFDPESITGLVGDTILFTEFGTMTIRDIYGSSMNDVRLPKIWTVNRKTRDNELKVITGTQMTESVPCLEIGNRDYLFHCAPEHRVLTPRGYLPAKDLRSEHVYNRDGFLIPIRFIRGHDDQDLYDLQIDGNRNYFANGIAVADRDMNELASAPDAHLPQWESPEFAEHYANAKVHARKAKKLTNE